MGTFGKRGKAKPYKVAVKSDTKTRASYELIDESGKKTKFKDLSVLLDTCSFFDYRGCYDEGDLINKNVSKTVEKFKALIDDSKGPIIFFSENAKYSVRKI